MSGYGSLRKRMQPPPQPERDPSACVALGCPCRGSVSLEGGGFTCTAHSSVPADRWPMVTERLRDHLWLIEFIDTIAQMDRVIDKNAPSWRDFAQQFWTGTDDYCLPDDREGFVPYSNRMRGELLYRCGLMKNRPAPRLPQVPIGLRFGNAGGLVGGRP